MGGGGACEAPPLLGLGITQGCLWGAAASHSLRYFHTALSEPVQGLPQFVQVGYVDDQPIDLNDSARQELPQVPRMELHADGPWPWDRRSRAPWSAEQVSLANLATLQKYYSQSGGLHTLQWMFGCELRSDGSKGGYMQFGYDGRDFLSLDKEHLRWTAADATAQLTKRKWEAEPAIAQGWKAYLEGECVEWLRRYLEYGKETLQRTEPPEVKVTHQKSSTENVETLVCQAHGFYPKEIEAAWTRDGENWEHGTFCNRVAPIPDGTYYISLYTDVEPEERGRYRCRVAHAGLSQPLALAWEGPAGAVTGALVLLLLVFAGIVMKTVDRGPSMQEAAPKGASLKVASGAGAGKDPKEGRGSLPPARERPPGVHPHWRGNPQDCSGTPKSTSHHRAP
uniref:Ig-like domain-containing protein n=1 Tax=Varanus komodoensis TaxID=61221 RepID=A0A8D2JBF3_VARKO